MSAKMTPEARLRDVTKKGMPDSGSPVKSETTTYDVLRSSTGWTKRANLQDMKPLPVKNMRKLFLNLAIQKEVIRGGSIRKLLQPSENDLREHFNKWDKDNSDAIDRQELENSLSSLNLKYTEEELDEIFKASDTNDDKKIDFKEFRRAAKTPCAIERWANGIPFARLLTLFIPDASREAEKKNPLAALLELAGGDETEARANMDKVIDQVVPSLKAFAFDHVMTLKKNFEKVKTLDDGRDVNTKFSSFELKYGLNVGGIQDFMKGLSHRIGLPHANILEGMKEEHCNMPNSNHEFESANYKIKTTAKNEWDVVQSGKYPSQKEYAAASDKHARRLRPMQQLKKLPQVKPDKNGENGLIEAEILAIVLYTGPNYMLYNAALRQDDNDAIYQTLKKAGNMFANTIHALVSAVLKLQRKSDVPTGLVLYRGLGRAVLPCQFFEKGLTEFGFMSTTSSKKVATDYSGAKLGNPMATVLAMQCGAVDRAAQLTEFSQFPGEDEYLWTPMCYIEAGPEEKQELEMTDDGLVKVLPVRVNTNLKSQTVEEIEGQRYTLLISTLPFHQRHLEAELTRLRHRQPPEGRGGDAKDATIDQADKGWEKLCGSEEEKARGASRATAKHIHAEYCKVCEKHKKRSPTWFNEDHNYRAAIAEIMEMKTAALCTFEHFLSSNQTTNVVLRTPLRRGFSRWQSTTKHQMYQETDPEKKKQLAKKLCHSEGLVFDSDDTEKSLVHLCDVAASGKRGHISLLLQAQAFKVDDKDGEGFSALMIAAEFGHMDCLQALLDAKADVNQKTDHQNATYTTALFLAAKEGHAKCVELLYTSGDRKNALLPGPGKHTPLGVSAFKGFTDCVKLLCDGAGEHEALQEQEVDLPGALDLPPLYSAVRQRSASCIKLLIDNYGKNEAGLVKITPVKMGDFRGQTPLTLAMGKWWAECPPAETSKRVEVVKELLDAGVDVNLEGKSSDPSRSGESATGLMQACLQGSVECVSLLLAANAQIDAQNSLGNNALHFAAQYGTTPEHLNCIDILLQTDPALSLVKNKNGKLPHELATDNSNHKDKIKKAHADLLSDPSSPTRKLSS